MTGVSLLDLLAILLAGALVIDVVWSWMLRRVDAEALRDRLRRGEAARREIEQHDRSHRTEGEHHDH